MRPLLAQLRVEVLLTLRRGESLLLTLGIPVLLLGFFSVVDVLPLPAGVDDPVDFLAPGVLALAVMSTAFTGLAIATGFEREYLVLKRLGSTPLGRGRLLAAKTGAIIVVEALQAAVLVAEALALGWRPGGGGVALAAGAMVLATVSFAGLGFLVAGTMPGLTTLAAANALYLVFLLLGGVAIPLSSLPAWLETAARTLPAAALSEAVRAALDGGEAAVRAWATLTGWAVVGPVAAAATFRWE